MPRGRKPNAVPSIDWKCHIPIDVAAKVDLLLLDPVSGKQILGARSELVTRLLRQFLAGLGGKPNPALDNLAAPLHGSNPTPKE